MRNYTISELLEMVTLMDLVWVISFIFGFWIGWKIAGWIWGIVWDIIKNYRKYKEYSKREVNVDDTFWENQPIEALPLNIWRRRYTMSAKTKRNNEKLMTIARELYTKYSAQKISDVAWFAVTTFHEIRREWKMQPGTVARLLRKMIYTRNILEGGQETLKVEKIEKEGVVWEKASEEEMSKLYILWQKLTTVMAQKDLADMLKVSQSTASFVCNKKIERRDEVLMYIEKLEKLAKGYNLIK